MSRRGGALLLLAVLFATAALLLRGGQPSPRVPRGAPPAAPARPAGPPPRGPAAPEPPAPPGKDPAPLPPPVDLDAVDRETVLAGLVLDDSGRPVPGAVLEAFRTAWSADPATGSPYRERLPPVRTLSARDGTFALPLAWGEVVVLEAAAPGHPAVFLERCLAGERVRVVLPRGRPAAVTVRDGAGNPVEGAWVRLRTGTIQDRSRTSSRATTDARGIARFESVPAGPASLDAKHADFGDFPGLDADVPPGVDPWEATLVLDPGLSVEGRVLDGETGSPVAGARVGRGPTLRRAVVTDDLGRFLFRGWNTVPGWDFGRLGCITNGYTRAEADVPSVGPVIFRLRRGDRVTGRVLDPAGGPVAGALVAAEGQERDPAGDGLAHEFRETVTSADGSFALEGLRRDVSSRLSVSAEGWPVLEAGIPRAEGGPGIVDLGDLRLPAGRRVSGVVLLSDGTPFTDGLVALGEPLVERRPDDRGRFRFPAVAAGTVPLFVVRPDAKVLLRSEVVLPADRDLEGLEIRLPAFHGLTVRVVDPAGRALPGVTVFATGPREMDVGETGEDGRVRFAEVVDAVVDLQAEQEDGEGGMRRLMVVEGEVPADGREVVLVMEEGVVIAGRILDGGGEGLAGIPVEARAAGTGEEWGRAVSGPGGRFRFRVPAGRRFSIHAREEAAEGRVPRRWESPAAEGPAEVEMRPAAEGR